MSKKLELTLFGNLEIREGGVLLTDFTSKKAQALLCFLAVTGQSQPRSILAALLWGGFPEEKARMNLSQALTTLRQYCRESLDITRQTITLLKNPLIWLDVDVFESTVMASSANANIPALQEAIQLYRGDFLKGFYVIKAPEFEEWVLTEQVRLREMALCTLDNLVVYFANTGIYEQSVDYARQLLAIEPWREGTHRQLMHLLALCGRRSAALKQYENCRQILLDELGVEPGAETSTLYGRIRAGEFVPPGEQFKITEEQRERNKAQELTLAGFSDRPRFSTNLPLKTTPFFGRERELADLDNLILNEGARLVTITGPGGIGKTRIALEFAEKMLPPQKTTTGNLGQETVFHFHDGIFFVPLEAIQSSDLILPAIAEAMRYQPTHGESQLLEYLESKRLLLIIDSFEQFLDGVEILPKILQSAKDVFILVTSRERLKLHLEQVYLLHGLEFPEIRTSKEVDYSAGKLFLQTARRRSPNFTLDESALNNLHQICCLVEGMPLALELAAAWTDMLPLSEIAVEIRRSFDFIATEFRDIPSRHRSVKAVMDGSWERLQQEGQNLFSQLSVFLGGFTREAAAVITGATIQSLSYLVDKSLLRYSPSQDRYYIHELLRQYGEEKLAGQSQVLEDLLNCHSEYYCRWFANQVTPRILRSVGQKTVLDAMAVELENVRKAWTWGIRNQRLQGLLDGVEAFGIFFRWRGGSLEGVRTFQVFIDCLPKMDEGIDAQVIFLLASLLTWQASFLIDLGEVNRGNQLLNKSQILLSSPKMSTLDTREARIHHLMETAFLTEYQSREIQRELQAQAISLYREIEHPFGLPHALVRGGREAIIAGRLDEADDFFHQSFKLYASVGNLIGQTRSLLGLGLVSLASNNFVEAEQLVQQAVHIAEEMEDCSRLAKLLLYLGPIYIFSGRFGQAHLVSEKCALTFAELAFPLHRAISMYYLGFAYLHQGDYNRAKECGEEAIRFIKSVDDINVDSLMLPEATTCMLSGATSLVQGDYVKALDMYNIAANSFVSRRSEVGIFGEGCVQVGRGTALLHLGRVSEAQPIFTSLLKRALATYRLPTLLHGLVGFALLFSVQGDVKRAGDLYSLAASHPFVRNSRWFSDLSEPFFEIDADEFAASGSEYSDFHGKHSDLWGGANRLLLEIEGL